MPDPLLTFQAGKEKFEENYIPVYYLDQLGPRLENAYATTDPKDGHIEFRDSDPTEDTAFHEFVHTLHLKYGSCPRDDCELIAYHFADWWMTTDRTMFRCSNCGYPVPEASEWTMCFRCGAMWEEELNSFAKAEAEFHSDVQCFTCGCANIHAQR